MFCINCIHGDTIAERVGTQLAKSFGLGQGVRKNTRVMLRKIEKIFQSKSANEGTSTQGSANLRSVN